MIFDFMKLRKHYPVKASMTESFTLKLTSSLKISVNIPVPNGNKLK